MLSPLADNQVCVFVCVCVYVYENDDEYDAQELRTRVLLNIIMTIIGPQPGDSNHYEPESCFVPLSHMKGNQFAELDPNNT